MLIGDVGLNQYSFKLTKQRAIPQEGETDEPVWDKVDASKFSQYTKGGIVLEQRLVIKKDYVSIPSPIFSFHLRFGDKWSPFSNGTLSSTDRALCFLFEHIPSCCFRVPSLKDGFFFERFILFPFLTLFIAIPCQPIGPTKVCRSSDGFLENGSRSISLRT